MCPAPRRAAAGCARQVRRDQTGGRADVRRSRVRGPGQHGAPRRARRGLRRARSRPGRAHPLLRRRRRRRRPAPPPRRGRRRGGRPAAARPARDPARRADPAHLPHPAVRRARRDVRRGRPLPRARLERHPDDRPDALGARGGRRGHPPRVRRPAGPARPRERGRADRPVHLRHRALPGRADRHHAGAAPRPRPLLHRLRRRPAADRAPRYRPRPAGGRGRPQQPLEDHLAAALGTGRRAAFRGRLHRHRPGPGLGAVRRRRHRGRAGARRRGLPGHPPPGAAPGPAAGAACARTLRRGLLPPQLVFDDHPPAPEVVHPGGQLR